jgi:hypothetical protein
MPFGVIPLVGVALIAFLTTVVLLWAEHAGGLMSPLRRSPTQPSRAAPGALVDGFRN